MKTKIIITVIPALLLAVVAYAQESGAKTQVKRGKDGAIQVGAVTKTWKVTDVDSANRTVTLLNDAGESNTVELSDRVRNFDQIKPGDEVKATLLESVAIGVRNSEAPPNASDNDRVAVASEGDAPAAAVAKTKDVTGKITAVDTTARTITLQGPAGGTKTFQAAPDFKLDQLKTGDNVTLRVTVALAVRVDKP